MFLYNFFPIDTLPQQYDYLNTTTIFKLLTIKSRKLYRYNRNSKSLNNTYVYTLVFSNCALPMLKNLQIIQKYHTATSIIHGKKLYYLKIIILKLDDRVINQLIELLIVSVSGFLIAVFIFISILLCIRWLVRISLKNKAKLNQLSINSYI